MYPNRHTYSSLRYGTIKSKQLLAIASEDDLQTLALTDINRNSACRDFARLSSSYNIKTVLCIRFRNDTQQQFILIAKNNNGFQNINDYLSGFLQDFELKIPEIAPELDNVLVIYPYGHKRKYALKENEFLGIKPQDLNHLTFSKWNSLRNKLVVLQTISFQNGNDFNTHQLLRAIENNTLLRKLSKNEKDQVMEKMFSHHDMSTIYEEFSEFVKNTNTIVESNHVDPNFSTENPNTDDCYTNNQSLNLQLSKKLTYDGSQYTHKKPGERIYNHI